ncbi:hypothetical protein ADUPG1_004713, partial [Aduncisulcus paluster]
MATAQSFSWLRHFTKKARSESTTGNPASIQAGSPPLSTLTFSCPIALSIHHARGEAS